MDSYKALRAFQQFKPFQTFKSFKTSFPASQGRACPEPVEGTKEGA